MAEEQDVSAVDIEGGKIGFIYVKIGKKKYKYTWVAIQGSSFFAYKDAKEITPSSVYQLKGSTITPTPEEGTDFSFQVMDASGKLVIALAGASQADRDSWVESIERASTLEPSDPPSKERTKKKSAAFRLKKAAAGKIAVSGVGKKAMKTAVNEETKLLIDALKTIVCKVHDQKKADEIEDHLIKIILKCFFLERNGDITMDDFLKADAPLREAFEVLIHMRDCRHRMSAERASENLRKVHLLIKQVETIITGLLASHLKPNSIKRVAIAFGLLGSIEFLTAGWSDESLEEERDMLSDAMNRYTAFHFN